MQVNLEPRPKRIRLSKKQAKFLSHVFVDGLNINSVIADLEIRPRIFDRWLTNPIFLFVLRSYLRRQYIQSHIELARGTSNAISGLYSVANNSAQHDQVRKACVDMLKFQSDIKRLESGPKAARPGPNVEQMGALLERFDAFLADNGPVWAQIGIGKKPQNPTTTPKNPVLTEISEQKSGNS